ncbi:MAG TPA: DNA primase, partial [Lysobacter sp.]|nr:DNA primase [Lysobacter sp.]
GGRVLGAPVDGRDAGPKYLNSPETPLFHKGRELYGLWQVRQAHNKIERLIVVEGYMDVVALFQHGVDCAVATLGTATTPDHAELLFRNAPDVYFCFDGDRAGRSAAWKAVESVLPRMKDGRQAFFLFLPEGEDPDSLVRQEGREGFDTRLREATPLSQFFFDSLSVDVNLSTLEGKGRLAERAKPLLAQIPDGAFGDLMKQRLTELTGVGARASTPDTHVPAQRARTSPASSAPKRSLVRAAIELLLHRPSLALTLQQPCRFTALRQAGIELLSEIVTLVVSRPDITTGTLIEHFADREESKALQKLAANSFVGDEQGLDHTFLGTMYQLELQAVEQRRAELADKLRELGPSGLDEYERAEIGQLLGEARSLRALINTYTAPL